MQSKDWILIFTSLLGGGSLVGALAYFFAPAADRLAANRKDADGKSFLRAGVVALCGWGDGLRSRVLEHEPSADIAQSNEVLVQVKRNLDSLG